MKFIKDIIEKSSQGPSPNVPRADIPSSLQRPPVPAAADGEMPLDTPPARAHPTVPVEPPLVLRQAEETPRPVSAPAPEPAPLHAQPEPEALRLTPEPEPLHAQPEPLRLTPEPEPEPMLSQSELAAPVPSERDIRAALRTVSNDLPAPARAPQENVFADFETGEEEAAETEASPWEVPAEQAAPEPIPEPPVVSAPRGGRRGGRVKTRLLGFDTTEQTPDPLATVATPGPAAATSEPSFPTGWIVVVDGPGRGAAFALSPGVAQIGRGEDQTICLDFGDTSISRQNHAALAYDSEQRRHYLGHGGKSNLVRLNDRPVLSTEELHNGDLIRIGETTLRFVAFCDGDFAWDSAGEGGFDHAAFA